MAHDTTIIIAMSTIDHRHVTLKEGTATGKE
jgi:hypothetical protein